MKSNIVDGKAIASKVKLRVRRSLKKLPRQTVVAFSFGHNDASRSYLIVKERFAKEVGVNFVVCRSDAKTTKAATSFMRKKLQELNPQGALVQLPLPRKLNTQSLLDAIPTEIDIDMLSAESVARFSKHITQALPPVVGAIDEILRNYKITLQRKKLVIVGAGVLVGKPTALYGKHRGAFVTVCDKFTKNLARETKKANVLVSGTGVAGLITPSHVTQGVITLDVGFSRKKGTIVGDIAPSVAKKAKLFSPVPGGIGVITVAKLFENLIFLQKKS